MWSPPPTVVFVGDGRNKCVGSSASSLNHACAIDVQDMLPILPPRNGCTTLAGKTRWSFFSTSSSALSFNWNRYFYSWTTSSTPRACLLQLKIQSSVITNYEPIKQHASQNNRRFTVASGVVSTIYKVVNVLISTPCRTVAEHEDVHGTAVVLLLYCCVNVQGCELVDYKSPNSY